WIGSLRRLVDDRAVEHRVTEHRVIAADARREHDLGAVDDRALGLVDLASGIAIECARLGPQRANFRTRALDVLAAALAHTSSARRLLADLASAVTPLAREVVRAIGLDLRIDR